MEIALVYMVAGLSSRFGGRIKQLVKVTDHETLIEYSLKQALPAGFTKIIFIVGNKTEQSFREKFGDDYKGIPVVYCLQSYKSEERDKPWGTTDALCSAKSVLNSAFVICNGDDIYGESAFKILVEHLKNKNTCATIGYKLGNSLPENGSVNRGIFNIKDNYVKSIIETLSISKENLILKGLSEENLCSMNIFALFPKALEELEKIIIKFKNENKNDKKIECFLPAEISNLIKEKKIIMEIYKTPEKSIGITNPEDELKVKEQLKIN